MANMINKNEIENKVLLIYYVFVILFISLISNTKKH